MVQCDVFCAQISVKLGIKSGELLRIFSARNVMECDGILIGYIVPGCVEVFVPHFVPAFNTFFNLR